MFEKIFLALILSLFACGDNLRPAENTDASVPAVASPSVGDFSSIPHHAPSPHTTCVVTCASYLDCFFGCDGWAWECRESGNVGKCVAVSGAPEGPGSDSDESF